MPHFGELLEQQIRALERQDKADKDTLDELIYAIRNYPGARGDGHKVTVTAGTAHVFVDDLGACQFKVEEGRIILINGGRENASYTDAQAALTEIARRVAVTFRGILGSPEGSPTEGASRLEASSTPQRPAGAR